MTGYNLMVDIDDVLFALVEGLHAKAHEMGLHDGTKAALEVWHGHEQYGCTEEQWYEVFAELHRESFYVEQAPIPGAAEALRQLYWAGHRINLVTARGFMTRGEEIRSETRQWVEEWAIPHHTLTFAQDKVAAQAELGRFDFAVDDSYKNYLTLDQDGVIVFLMTKPHNAKEPIRDYRRVSTMDEFASLVLNHATFEDFPQRYLLGAKA